VNDFGQMTSGLSDQAQSRFGPKWVTLEEVYALHERQLSRFGGPSGVRDTGALESALNRARNKWNYEGADLAMMGAAHAYGIAKNHPFIDGNKRAAFVTMMLFLRKNAMRFAPPPAEATVIMLALAAGETSEDGLARWIRDRSSAV